MLPQLDEFFLKILKINLANSSVTHPLCLLMTNDLHVLSQKMRIRNFSEEKIGIILKLLNSYLSPKSPVFEDPSWIKYLVLSTQDPEVLWVLLLCWKTSEAGFLLDHTFPVGNDWERIYLQLKKKIAQFSSRPHKKNYFLHWKGVKLKPESSWKKIPFWVLLSFSGLILSLFFNLIQWNIERHANKIIQMFDFLNSPL